jgi:hypothetical protein
VAGGSALFLDTSVQIARLVHAPETKRRIESWIAQYDITVSSGVVKLEFKRRLLKEAQYLLNQLDRRGSLQRVQRHVIDHLPPQQGRKKQICLQTLQTIFEGRDEEEVTERARRWLRTLLKHGLNEFDRSVGSVIKDAGCACAQCGVVERMAYRSFDFGIDRCSKSKGRCGIVSFIVERRDLVGRIHQGLKSIPEQSKTDELKRAEAFLDQVVESPESAISADPCTKVGDLIIALESAKIPALYTLNYRESQYFCRWLDQVLIVRPNNYERDDVVCLPSEPNWDRLLQT